MFHIRCIGTLFQALGLYGRVRDMRIEQAHFFLYGAIVIAIAWGISAYFSSTLVRFHVRALFLALGLGFILVPGHGEFIVAPILAVLVAPIVQPLLILAIFFFLFWWAISLTLLSLARRYSRKLPPAV